MWDPTDVREYQLTEKGVRDCVRPQFVWALSPESAANYARSTTRYAHPAHYEATDRRLPEVELMALLPWPDALPGEEPEGYYIRVACGD